MDDTLNLPGLLGSAVRVDLPRVAPSTKANFPLHIEVTIGSTRPSFFQGVVGVTQQRTGAMGVATTGSDFALPVSLPALDPTGCGSNKINGAPGTAVTTNGHRPDRFVVPNLGIAAQRERRADGSRV